MRLDRLRIADVQAWLSRDILQSFDGRGSDGHGLLLLTVRSVPLRPTDRAATELPGNFGRTAGQDLQEMLVLLLVDLAAGEPLCRDLLWRKLSW